MLHRLLPLLLVLFVAACATPPESPVDAQARHAERLFQEKQYEAAADLYLALAGQAGGEKRLAYRLLAADSLLQAGEEDKGRKLLAGIDPQLLPPRLQRRYRLVQAGLRLQQEDAAGALQLLEGLEQEAGPELARRTLALRARAQDLLGDRLGQARTLIRLEPMVQEESERLALQLQILSILVRQPPQVLDQELPPDETARGWAELASLLRGYPNDPQGVAAPFQEWRSLYPGHPALPSLLASWYEAQQRLAPARVGHIAVLLPGQGPYAAAAEAIRAGILAAWYATDAEQRPLVTFHDSSDPERIWPLLHQVAEAGADMVIGPLAKQSVLQLARAGSLPLPVLALNRVSTDTLPPANLYQYGLSPEEEAKQAALQAASMGLGTPGVLHPDSAWGERLFRAFEEQWLMLDRAPIGRELYHPEKNDYSEAVARLLKIEEAKAEHAKAEEEAGEELPFEPEMPVDFIFVVGHKPDLLRLRPLIRFHHGTSLPVLTLSRAWKGSLDREEAFDLEGVMLPEIPWLAEPERTGAPLTVETATHLFPDGMRKYPRLVAMGMDAYALLPELNRLALPEQPPLQGATGELSLDARHQVRRRLTWVVLGTPVRVLGPTPSPESIDPTNWSPLESESEVLPEDEAGEATPPEQR